MLTNNLNVRCTQQEMDRFSLACEEANAGKSEVLRMLMALAVKRGLIYNSHSGALSLRTTPRKQSC